MRRLLGWAVLLGLLVFAIGYVSGHWPSRFGCDRGGVAVAHADTGGCPPNIAAAESDSAWAASRIAAIDVRASDGKRYTYGEFCDPDGTEHWFVSGQDADADTARDIGRAAGVFPASGTVVTVEHVEVKVAAHIRAAGLGRGVLVINNPSGPCGQDRGGVYSCSAVLPKLLPPRTSLAVWWPTMDPAHPRHRTFTGGER